MKILIICQYYYPEPFRITDVCEELVKRGNEVLVVTGVPNYPEGKTYSGYEHGNKRDETINGVRVHRCFTIARRKGFLFRVLNYYSFSFSSTCFVKKLKEDFDVVFVNQLSPIMMAKAGVAFKKKRNKKLVLYCLDLWPESLVAGGIKVNSFLYKHYKQASGKIYRQADKVFVTSQGFSQYFKDNFGIADTEYLPQYSETLFSPESCKKSPNEFVDLMFAGNIGAAQSVNTIIEAAKLTQDIKNLRWHIVGDGSELDRIKAKANGFNNVFFYGRQQLEKMPEFYSKADAMIVTLKKDSALSLTLPGKIQTYLAAGKPIIGAINGEAQNVIRESNCGFCGDAENAEQLAANVRRFAGICSMADLGDKALTYYNQFFNKDVFFDKLLSSFKGTLI